MNSIFYAIPMAFLFGMFRYGFSKYVNVNPKLNESLIKLMYYFLAYTFNGYLISQEGIWPDVWNCWDGLYEGQYQSPILTVYYICELAWYISEMFCLFLIDSHKKDHKQMVIHHLVTIGLIGISFIYGYHRIGLLVLSCHNINDIFLEGAKSFKYLGFPNAANITFAGLIISWIYSRFYVFVYYILDSTIFFVHEMALSDSTWFITYYICNSMLLTLLFLNIRWFFMICKIAINAIKNGEPEDERENESDLELKQEFNNEITLDENTDIYSDIGMDLEKDSDEKNE